MNAALVVAIAALLVAPLATYLTIVRRMSGKIATTEAGRLWDASEAMRKEYRDEITRLQGVVDRMRTRLDEVEAKNSDLHRLVGVHEDTITDLRAQVRELRERNTVLEAENEELKRRVGEVEAHGS